MANHIYFNQQTQFGSLLRSFLGSYENADDKFKDIRDCMVQMLEGDGSQDSHYTTIQSRFGFETTASAHAAFSEIDSCYSKLSVNTSVTNVRAAIDQLLSKLRG